jgi:hypothetical protein
MAGLSEALADGIPGAHDVLTADYSRRRRAVYMASATALGVVVAGFWNFRVVDGFGADIVAAHTIGDYQGKASQFAALGAGFGFVFAMVAGLAATFTACNCVAFAMIPGLTCARDAREGRSVALQSHRPGLCLIPPMCQLSTLRLRRR